MSKKFVDYEGANLPGQRIYGGCMNARNKVFCSASDKSEERGCSLHSELQPPLHV